jgi:hypothetical protein
MPGGPYCLIDVDLIRRSVLAYLFAGGRFDGGESLTGMAVLEVVVDKELGGA